ncbi:MAG: hypothetical protein L0Y73_05400, partial [Candidatus Aminicenantes bacterium]|nr:hypothetical protein [Candidatus Aminicenantes bacterium]
MADEILFFSRFVLDETAGGGGCKREAQLGQALRPLNYKFISAGESSWMKNQVHGIKNLLFRLAKKYHPYKKYWIDFYQDTMFRLRAQAIDWGKLVARDKALKCVIIDDPIYFYPLVAYLHRRKIPIVGLCHNIESLSYSQLKSDSQLELFQKE